MNISDKIVSIRESKRMKQLEVAEKLNTERSNYARLEKRGDKLTLEQLVKISEALGVTLIELLTWEEGNSEAKIIKELLDRSFDMIQKELYDNTEYLYIIKNLISSNPDIKKLVDQEFQKIYDDRIRKRKDSIWSEVDPSSIELPKTIDEEMQHRINGNKNVLDWIRTLKEKSTK